MTKKITNEDLAQMIQHDVVEQMATKDDIEKLDQHLARIEEQILGDHQRRIERIEEALVLPKVKAA